MLRVGTGYDAHALVDQRPLILGGVQIPYNQGLDGHSDADVVSHAIVDSLLGAAGLGDIGQHFPANQKAYEGISSMTFLENVQALLKENKWKISNVDATIIADRPRLNSYLQQMGQSVSRALDIDESQVSIKASSSNGLGFPGAGLGIAAQAVALIETINE